MHNPVISLLLAISLILGCARLAGAAARRLGQPRVLGELLIGVVLGPTVLNPLHWPILSGGHVETTITELAELGVLILMFTIGLEIQPRELLAPNEHWLRHRCRPNFRDAMNPPPGGARAERARSMAVPAA